MILVTDRKLPVITAPLDKSAVEPGEAKSKRKLAK